jgi:hypothetical protein
MMDDAFIRLRERGEESLGEDVYVAIFDAAAQGEF